MDITRCTTNLEQFRYELYQNFGNRADTLMNLVDAMCSYPQAQSVVEYSLAPVFLRSYSTISKALTEVTIDEKMLPSLISPYLPPPRQRRFRLLMVDVTPQPRPHADTLSDRGMVYQPTVVKGNKPVTIGHQYSSVTLALEPEAGFTASWALPLMTRRVASDADKEMVGADQIDQLLQAKDLPFADELCVEVVDSSYSKRPYLHAHRHHKNLVTIARVANNRVFYHQYVPEAGEATPPGHPTWYGDRFALSEPETWTTPDEEFSLWETNRRGERQRVVIKTWHNMLMTGKYQPERIPMNEYPFTLVRIVRYDENGQPLHKRPLWLLVMGERRHELSGQACYDAYGERFDIEHFFRFGKQKLLMTGFQTPETTSEENWWQLTHIAAAQLWMARHLAQALPRPWERNLPAMKDQEISPTLVQRDFERIIRQIGTPARLPKPRGKSPGRRKGTKLPKRLRKKVVVKSQKTDQAA